MKKLYGKFAAALLCVCCAIALFGCDFGGGESNPPSQPGATYVTAKINYHYEYNVAIENYYQETYSLLKDTESVITELYTPPVKLGYRFLGWTKSEGGEGEVISSLTITGSGGTGKYYSLYAKYELIEYNVVYHLNGGTNSARNPEEGATLTGSATLYDPMREGYKFVGWYRDPSFETPASTVSLIDNNETTVHYYAKWAEIFSITFVSNIGKPLPYVQDTSYAEGFLNPVFIALPDNLRIDGYLFIGWTFEGQETPTFDEGKLSVELPVGTTGDKVFTANYKEVTDLDAIGATYELKPFGTNGVMATLTVPAGITEVVLSHDMLDDKLIVIYSGDEPPKVYVSHFFTGEIVYEKAGETA